MNSHVCMVVLLGCWWLMFQTTSANFLVQLSNTTSLLYFLQEYPFLAKNIIKTYSFGSFQALSVSGDFSDNRLINVLRGSRLVQAISPDVQVTARDVQLNAPRHLARTSRRAKLPTDDSGNVFYYTSTGQSDVDIYIIDTGINSKHVEFEGRVSRGMDFTGEGLGDKNGHGTHVAGIAGSKTYGASKKTNIVEIKVLTGTGTGNLSAVIAGIEYAVNDYKALGRKAVANLSLGAGFNSLLNSAVNAAVDSGLPMVVAAGNSNSAACASSPASALKAITVGAIDDRYDTIASFSNWGSCVSLFASGVYVTSLSHTSDTATLALSGTSMATPIITGTIAMYMGLGDSTETAVARILEWATADMIDRRSMIFRPRTPNLLLYNGMNESDNKLEDSLKKEMKKKKDESENRTKKQVGASPNSSLSSSSAASSANRFPTLIPSLRPLGGSAIKPKAFDQQAQDDKVNGKEKSLLRLDFGHISSTRFPISDIAVRLNRKTDDAVIGIDIAFKGKNQEIGDGAPHDTRVIKRISAISSGLYNTRTTPRNRSRVRSRVTELRS